MHRARFASVNAKVTNCLIIKATATLAAAIRSFLMVHASARQDITEIHAESVLFLALPLNLPSRELAPPAHSILSSTLPSMDAHALLVSTWITLECAKN